MAWGHYAGCPVFLGPDSIVHVWGPELPFSSRPYRQHLTSGQRPLTRPLPPLASPSHVRARGGCEGEPGAPGQGQERSGARMLLPQSQGLIIGCSGEGRAGESCCALPRSLQRLPTTMRLGAVDQLPCPCRVQGLV